MDKKTKGKKRRASKRGGGFRIPKTFNAKLEKVAKEVKVKDHMYGALYRVGEGELMLANKRKIEFSDQKGAPSQLDVSLERTSKPSSTLFYHTS